jgi:hypothetical protein
MASMTSVEKVLAARSPKDALIVLATILDEQERRLQQLEAAPADDGWGSWGDHDAHVEAHQEFVKATRAVGEEAPEYTAVEIPVDPVEVARLQAEYDQANELFEQLRRSGAPKHALIEQQNIAEGIRGRLHLAKDPGKILPVSGDMVGDPDKLLVVDVAGDPTIGDVTINLPPASDEQKALRAELWEQAGIVNWFEPVFRQTDDAVEQLKDAFVKGGPMWLYGNRDLVLGLPRWARERLVKDVEMYGDTRMTHEFARDVLKQGAGADDEPDELALQRFKEATWAHSDMGAPAPFQGNGVG